MWFLFALLSGLGSAILAVIVKMYLKHLNPFLITFFFFTFATLILLLIGIFTKKLNYSLISTLTKNELATLIIAGGVHASAFAFYILALNCGKLCSVVALDRLGILYVVILSVLFLQEAFKIKSVIGAILMILGTVLLSS